MQLRQDYRLLEYQGSDSRQAISRSDGLPIIFAARIRTIETEHTHPLDVYLYSTFFSQPQFCNIVFMARDV